MEIIKLTYKEFREGDLAVKETLITFFGLPIIGMRKTSTNNRVVTALTAVKSDNKIIGFNNENEN